jgi:hypothetical protein
MGYYGMEKEPKGVKSSDRTGEKMGSEKRANSLKGTPTQTGVKTPAGATASDMSGERKQKLVGGVAMGKADGIGERDGSHMGKNDGRLGEMKGGSSESVCYDHKRIAHVQDGM